MKSVANNSWVKCDELRIEVLRVKTVFNGGERITEQKTLQIIWDMKIFPSSDGMPFINMTFLGKMWWITDWGPKSENSFWCGWADHWLGKYCKSFRKWKFFWVQIAPQPYDICEWNMIDYGCICKVTIYWEIYKDKYEARMPNKYRVLHFSSAFGSFQDTSSLILYQSFYLLDHNVLHLLAFSCSLSGALDQNCWRLLHLKLPTCLGCPCPPAPAPALPRTFPHSY